MPTTKHWTTEPDKEANIKLSLSGPASAPTITFMPAFLRTVSKFPNHPALRVKRNGSWVSWTFRQYYNDVTRAAKSMIKLGVEPHHGVGIIGFNAPEWSISYMASIMVGGIATGVYTTNSAETCQYIADCTEAQLFVCENDKQLMKMVEIKDNLPHLKAIVKYLPETEHPLDPTFRDAGVITWEEFMEIGKDVPDYEVSWRIESQKPGHCASLIFTSGTTGPPKGAMISHDNIVWSGSNLARSYNATEVDCLISYLPLSHIAGQIADIIIPALAGCCIWFAQPDALKGSLKETLVEARPTVFFTVPRVWEKFKEAMEIQLKTATGIKALLFEKAREVGKKSTENRLQGGSVAWGYWLANTIVFKNLRGKIGLDCCRLTISAAAPLPISVTEFFGEFDITIHQTYGMSECTGVSTITNEGSYKRGSVGYSMNGIEVKIHEPDENGDGEICFRGRHVFMGYLNQEEKTREAIDEDGWLHSGDIGRVDGDGFFYITGRSKEIIITKGGENIAPVPIEECMKDHIRCINNVMIVGDDQRYLTMLVTLRCEFDDSRNPTDDLDTIGKLVMNEIGSTALTVSAARTDPVVIQYIQGGMEAANEKAISRAARVQKFAILPVDFSIDNGELTPTMKLKRSVVLQKYQDIIEEMYSE